MDEISSMDIDNLYDFRFAEFILKYSKTYE